MASMASWHKVTITQRDIRDGKHIKLQDEFGAVFLAHRGPSDAAMFTPTAIQFPADYFFSPGAVEIAGRLIERYGGSPCSPPAQSGLSLLVGNAGRLEIPFATSR